VPLLTPSAMSLPALVNCSMQRLTRERAISRPIRSLRVPMLGLGVAAARGSSGTDQKPRRFLAKRRSISMPASAGVRRFVPFVSGSGPFEQRCATLGELQPSSEQTHLRIGACMNQGLVKRRNG
jgi:hypothetical protein